MNYNDVLQVLEQVNKRNHPNLPAANRPTTTCVVTNYIFTYFSGYYMRLVLYQCVLDQFYKTTKSLFKQLYIYAL